MDEEEIDDGRKRGRREHDGDVEPEDDDDGDYNDNISSPPPNKKKKKKSSDNAAEHSPMNDRHINPTGKPAEAGIIQEVYVENFMCHRKLSVKLCRNVNFIHGQNGSGKSAILAAIQVCLGAGARRTHRARNLKDLVRKEAGADCSGAKLRVTLLNKGSDGFMPEVYGDTITVERCISMRSGGFNGYKLLDQNGKEQSRKKADLDAMLDQLNIQVENPVAVLDQEEAKKFLTGKAEDKYAFFTKATELERLDRCYANIHDNIMEQQDVKRRAREGIQGFIDNTMKLKKEWEQFNEIDEMEVELQRCRAEGAWAVYKEMQEKLDVDMREAQKFSKSLEKRRVELANYEAKLNVTDDEEIALKNQLEDLTEEARLATEAKRKLEQDLKIAENPIKAKERDIKILRTEIKTAEKKLKSARRRLDQARQDIIENQGNAAEEERTRTRKIAETESDLARAKERVASVKEQVRKFLREYEDLEDPRRNANEAQNGTERQLNAVQQKIRSLQSEAGGGNNTLAMFGPKCKPMYDLVQKYSRKFKGPVAGPVGMYLKIVNGKEQYAKIAEFAIGGGNLDRFIVTNQDDLKLMDRLRKEVGCSPRDCAIYMISPRSTQEKYNTPAPPDGVETVTSVVSVENAMVFNFLVDFCKIDESALADSKESSEAKLLSENNGKYSIRGKVKKVFCLPAGDLWQVNKGLLNIVSNDRPLKQTIGVDRSAAIDSAKHELNAIQKELDRNKREVKAIGDQSNRAKREWNVHKKENEALTTKITKMEQLLEELKEQAEASEEVPTIDTTEFENDITVAEEELDDLKKKEITISQDIESLQPGVEELKEKLDETATRNGKILDDMDKVEAGLEDIVKGQNRRQEVVEKCKAKVREREQALIQQEEIVAEAKETVANALLAARKVQFATNRQEKRLEEKEANGGIAVDGVDDMNDEPSEQDLEAIDIVEPRHDLKRCQARVASREKKIENEKMRRNLSEVDPAVARDKYLRAKKALDSKMEQIEAIEQNVKMLLHDVKERKKRWVAFRAHIAEMTNLSFDEFLQKKKSAGQVEFDHDHGRLNLIVQKDNTDESTQTNDVKALSGGERSFATLSLLLAIGESLETPFRVMDEFDVFLDPVARKLALNTLIKISKEMEHRQFIFITPQDLSNIETDPKLRIFHLKPPVRSSMVGGPQQQTLNF